MPTYRSPSRDPRDLKLYGPRLKVKIGHPLLRTREINSPAGVASTLRFTTTDALIDTGAQRTILVPEAVQKVGLSKVDETNLNKGRRRNPSECVCGLVAVPALRIKRH